MISDNLDVGLGIVDCSLYTHPIALEDDYHQKRRDMLAYTPVEFNYSETKVESFIIPTKKTSSFRKKVSTKLQFFGVLSQWLQAPDSLDPMLKIPSGINNLISDKLEY